jgi:hypothetical protein
LPHHLLIATTAPKLTALLKGRKPIVKRSSIGFLDTVDSACHHYIVGAEYFWVALGQNRL